MSIVRAERVTIQLGDIPLNVYQLPDGSYRLSGRNITEAIKEAPNTLSRSMGVKTLEALPGAGSERYKVSAGKDGSPFHPVAVEDAVTYWGIRAQQGNALAVGLLTACAIEAIERRADKALGVKRSEEERNLLLESRTKRIAARFAWTDIIKQDQERRGVYSSKAGNYEFAEFTRMVNQRLFGVSHFKCNRDLMNQDQQMDIIAFERLLKSRYRQGQNLESQIMECLDFYQGVNG